MKQKVAKKVKFAKTRKKALQDKTNEFFKQLKSWDNGVLLQIAQDAINENDMRLLNVLWDGIVDSKIEIPSFIDCNDKLKLCIKLYNTRILH